MTDTLDLVLTHHWFDMIAHGDKREEYRANTEYYRKRLTELKTPLPVLSESRRARNRPRPMP